MANPNVPILVEGSDVVEGFDHFDMYAHLGDPVPDEDGVNRIDWQYNLSGIGLIEPVGQWVDQYDEALGLPELLYQKMLRRDMHISLACISKESDYSEEEKREVDNEIRRSLKRNNFGEQLATVVLELPSAEKDGVLAHIRDPEPIIQLGRLICDTASKVLDNFELPVVYGNKKHSTLRYGKVRSIEEQRMVNRRIKAAQGAESCVFKAANFHRVRQSSNPKKGKYQQEIVTTFEL